MIRTIHRLACLLPLSAALLAAEVPTDPAPAEVSTGPGKPISGFVMAETMNGGVSFAMGDPKDSSTPRAVYPFGTYHLEYKPTQNHDLLTGMAAERTKIDLAIDSYTAASQTARYEWERESAYLALGRLADTTKRYPVGIKALQEFQTRYPHSVNMPKAMYLLGHDLAESGDVADAVKVFGQLTGHAQDWGLPAAVMGSVGKAEALALDKKADQAIAELKPWMSGTTLLPEKFPEEYGKVGMTLGGLLAQAKDAGACDTYRQVAYAPCGAALQSAAQLGWARVLADKGDPNSLLDAFDHAAIAAVLPGADNPTRGQATELATSLVARIAATGADDAAKQKLTVKYRSYLAKLK